MTSKSPRSTRRTRPDPAITPRRVRRLLVWYGSHARDLPWRRTRNPYAIWVSEIMLQQTQVKTVRPYWERWMETLPDLESLARARLSKLHQLWEGLGYYRRVRLMRAAARLVRKRHGGRFPSSFDDVLELPGVGRYTAGAICSIAYDHPTAILDGNVTRVLTRFHGIAASVQRRTVVDRLWALAQAWVDQAGVLSKSSPSVSAGVCGDFNQALMELGATICLPTRPQCRLCPWRSGCRAHRLGKTEDWPRTGKKPASVAQYWLAVVWERRGRVLVRQRPKHVVNGAFWEFPNAELPSPTGRHRRACLAKLGVGAEALGPPTVVRHSITRYRIHLEAIFIPVRSGRGPTLPGAVWIPLRRLGELPLTSAHRKVARALVPSKPSPTAVAAST